MKEIKPEDIWNKEKTESIKNFIMENKKDKLIALYQEYDEFFKKHYEDVFGEMVQLGGWCEEKDIQKIQKYREDILKLTEEIGYDKRR